MFSIVTRTMDLSLHVFEVSSTTSPCSKAQELEYNKIFQLLGASSKVDSMETDNHESGSNLQFSYYDYALKSVLSSGMSRNPVTSSFQDMIRITQAN